MTDVRQLSDQELRKMISRGELTAEAWGELKERNERVQAGMAVIRTCRRKTESI